MIKVIEGYGRSRMVKEGHVWSFPITRLIFQVRKVTGGGVGWVSCRILVSAPAQSHSLSSGLWIWDLGLGFGTWIWDHDFGLGFGTGLGLDNELIVVESLTAFLFLRNLYQGPSPCITNPTMSHLILRLHLQCRLQIQNSLLNLSFI